MKPAHLGLQVKEGNMQALPHGNCRSWTVNMTQDLSISWMAKCMPYSIVLLPECLGLQVKEGIMQALPHGKDLGKKKNTIS